MGEDSLVLYIAFLAIAFALGVLSCWLFYRYKFSSFEKIAAGIVSAAEQEADGLKKACELQIKQTHIDQQREFEQLRQIEKRKITREEEWLKAREDKVEGRISLLDKKIAEIEKKEALLSRRKNLLDEEKSKAVDTHQQLLDELEKVGGLSAQEAKDLLIDRLTNDVKNDAANMIRRIRKEAEEEADAEARRIIVTAINRLAVPTVSEATVNTVAIPNDEMKGRIIGREGRNIRTLEKLTGVNYIIDDTPGAVVLSGFDPLRMEVAKTTLKELIVDGRIHPTRIEECVEKARGEVGRRLKRYGEDAALRAGAMNLHPELIMLLGKLKLRYSFGQNVLDHSMEVSNLMGMMAAELGLDVQLAKRIGLLHDIGKAVSHEVEGSHAIIGHDMALRLGESKGTANGIGCHHGEMPVATCEGALCAAADALSASRPGGRIEAVEEYVKRLRKLEDIAHQFDGVGKAYAMQAGRELLVLVQPEALTDETTLTLGKELTKRIEKELAYPGKIKVTMVREYRFVDYAV